MELQEILAMTNLSDIDPNMLGLAGGLFGGLAIVATTCVLDLYVRPKVAPYIRQGLEKIPRRKREVEEPELEEEFIYQIFKPKDS